MNPTRLLFLIASVLCSFGAAPGPDTLRIVADRYLAKQPLPILDNALSMEEALRAQATFVDLLTPQLGDVAGFKIGLITRQGQERMNAPGPVHGALLKKMLHSDGAVVSAHYGVKPGLELDMGVLVRDEKINNATTLAEVLPHIAYVVCFIELVDTITATNQPMNAPLLTALNVGARSGVLGSRLKMTPELAKALPDMRMFLTDETGKVTADVPKLDLQPLDNLPWLIAELKKTSRALKKGDFISVGSPAPIQPVVAGKKMTLHYEIAGQRPMTATVKFKE